MKNWPLYWHYPSKICKSCHVSLTVGAVVLRPLFMMICSHHQERGRWMYRIDPWCRPSGCPIDARSTVALPRKWEVSDKGNFIGLYIKYGLSHFARGGAWIVACYHQKTRGLLQEMTVTGNCNLDGTAIWTCAEKFTWRSYKRKPSFQIISQVLQYLIVNQRRVFFFSGHSLLFPEDASNIFLWNTGPISPD